MRGAVLRAMSNPRILTDIDEHEDEMKKNGDLADSKMVDIEVSKKISIGNQVLLKNVVGMKGTVTNITNNAATVQLTWSLANNKNAIAYVQLNDLLLN
jgi:hypothetical protein